MLQKIIDFFSTSADDLKDLDAKVKTKVEEYSTKQVRKAAIFGAIAGLIVGALAGSAF